MTELTADISATAAYQNTTNMAAPNSHDDPSLASSLASSPTIDGPTPPTLPPSSQPQVNLESPAFHTSSTNRGHVADPFAATCDPTTGTDLLLKEVGVVANGAAAHPPVSPQNPAPRTHAATTLTEDAAFAAMQEAAAIVMEQQQRQKLQPRQEQHPQPSVAPFPQSYTYAAANTAYSPSINARNRNVSHRADALEPTIFVPTPATITPMLENDNGDRSRSPKKRSSPPSGANNKESSKKRSAPTRVSWDERVRQLKEYKDKYGDLLIPIRYKPSNLGKFVHNTREQYKLFHKQTPDGYKKKCSLTEARIQQLDNLGFAWTTERSKRQNDDWERRLQQLEEFKQKNGHCLVPHGYSEDSSFAEWVHRQRTSYNSFLKAEEKGSAAAAKAAQAANPMMQARFQSLKDMGFNFTVHTDKWMQHWNQLKEYKEKHGDCQVPTHYSENQKLGRWVHTQRHQRRLQGKGKKSCMTPERIALLDQLGFSWEVRASLERPRATWHQRLDELKTYHKKHGHFQIDSVAMPHLHAWCHEQKNRLKVLDKNNGRDMSKRMNEERVQALKWIGFTKDTVLLDSGTTPTAVVAGADDLETADLNTDKTTTNPMVAVDGTHTESSHEPTPVLPAPTTDVTANDTTVSPNVETNEWKDKQDNYDLPNHNGQSEEESLPMVLI